MRSFDFGGVPPTVTVSAVYSKRRRDAVAILRTQSATDLRSFLATKLPDARAFCILGSDRVAKMLRVDLEAAGIPYRDEAGRVAELHALRHTLIRNLTRSGVHREPPVRLPCQECQGCQPDRWHS